MRRIAVGTLLVAVSGLALLGCSSGPAVPPSSSTSSTSSTASTAPTSSTTVPSTTAPGSASLFPYFPLWPFRTFAEVQAWQASYRSGGHEPWHRQAGTTALDFAQHYLGFENVTAVVRTTTDSRGAHVSVGFSVTAGRTTTAAVVHLVTWGTGADAPWEVVGTDDTTFTLTSPSYGATGHSPLSVGGAITGVDESIRVAVRQPSSSNALGTACCLPAGGTASPWATSVSYAGATDPVLTVVASTGGHVQDVERFAVTAVRTSP